MQSVQNQTFNPAIICEIYSPKFNLDFNMVNKKKKE